MGLFTNWMKISSSFQGVLIMQWKLEIIDFVLTGWSAEGDIDGFSIIPDEIPTCEDISVPPAAVKSFLQAKMGYS